MARSARAIAHLIPEVRPLPGQRVALFKNAPGVFYPGAGRFPPLPVFPALELIRCYQIYPTTRSFDSFSALVQLFYNASSLLRRLRSRINRITRQNHSTPLIKLTRQNQSVPPLK